VNVTIIAINVVVFIWSAIVGLNKVAFTYGAVPHALMTMSTNQPINPVLTVFTSMFLHGGLLHIGGNMLYLWIFGDNIEDQMGPVRYIFFYLACGVVAAYSNAAVAPGSMTPMIGASGAIAGVLGAYLLLFPRTGVYTIVFLGFFVQVVKLPALIVIGFWAIIQLVSGLFSAGQPGGGVAWFAHVGGFIFGVATIKLLVKDKYRRHRQWS
jgi:membrane associated rhomboid family serine protease